MKKIYALLICVVLFISCSSLQAVNPTATPQATSAPIDTPTFTPVTPTLTFTFTPMMMRLDTRTPTPTLEFTLTQLPITPLILITPNTPTPSVDMEGFIAINISEKEFYKTAECQPALVKFTAQVADARKTAFVLLFVRFKSKQTDASGEWADSIAMQSMGGGTFAHDLVATEMKGLEYFKNAWVQYQLVATDADANILGRTGIFSERLTLLECEPTPTPMPTATALKP